MKYRLTQDTDTALAPFIGHRQMLAIKTLLRGEEGEHFAQTLRLLALLVKTMPKTGETDGEGADAIVQLHYFYRGCDWYITERDTGDGSDDDSQHQAFGYANLGDPQNAEFGYISLPELFESAVELDLYWEPKPLKDCTAYRS